MAAAEAQTPALSVDLLNKLAEVAHAQERSVSEVVTEAVTKYLDERRWESLLKSARERARAMGLTEADVPRLIAESRAEQRSQH